LTLTANGCVGGLQWSTGATTTDITINVTATTLFSVTCTTGLNCKATARKQIGFVPVVLDVVTSSGQICSGAISNDNSGQLRGETCYGVQELPPNLYWFHPH